MSRVRLLLLVALLAGCSLDYDSVRLSDEIDQSIPDTVLISFTQIVVRDGTPRFVVTAERARTFVDQRRQYLDGVSFEERAADGRRTTYGTADSAVFETDTENVALTGSLQFYSEEEDAWLSAESLFWDSESRTLSSDPAESVLVRRGETTQVRGSGFSADMARSTVRFDGGVSGTIIEESDE